MAKNDGLVEVTTTMRPDKKMRVTELEAESLYRKGVLDSVEGKKVKADEKVSPEPPQN